MVPKQIQDIRPKGTPASSRFHTYVCLRFHVSSSTTIVLLGSGQCHIQTKCQGFFLIFIPVRLTRSAWSLTDLIENWRKNSFEKSYILNFRFPNFMYCTRNVKQDLPIAVCLQTLFWVCSWHWWLPGDSEWCWSRQQVDSEYTLLDCTPSHGWFSFVWLSWIYRFRRHLKKIRH